MGEPTPCLAEMPEHKWWMAPFVEAYSILSYSANESGNIPLSEVLTYWEMEKKFVPKELFVRAIIAISSVQQKDRSDRFKKQRQDAEKKHGRNSNNRHKGSRKKRR